MRGFWGRGNAAGVDGMGSGAAGVGGEKGGVGTTSDVVLISIIKKMLSKSKGLRQVARRMLLQTICCGRYFLVDQKNTKKIVNKW